MIGIKHVRPTTAAFLLVSTLIPTQVQAGLGDCGQPFSDGARPTSTDALTTLKAAVSLTFCALSVCDVDSSGTVTPTDALTILKFALNQPISLSCPPEMPDWPNDPDDYVTGPVSYMNTLSIPPVEGTPAVPTCCKDFGEISRDFIQNGTDYIDNALAKLSATLVALGIDFGELLTDSIVSGDLLILFDHQFLQYGDALVAGQGARSLPDDFLLAQLGGLFDAGTTYEQATAGNGQFLIGRSSFLEGTAEPANYAFPAHMDASSMTAGPFTLEIQVPFGFLSLDLVAAEAEVTADHGTVSAAGVEYSNGTIAGYVLIDDIFGGINDILNSSLCECLGHGEDIYQKDMNGAWSSVGRCVSDPGDTCTQPDQEVCITLAGGGGLGVDPFELCALLPALVPGVGDINLDADDSTFEGMSLGLEFTGVPAEVTGLELEVP